MENNSNKEQWVRDVMNSTSGMQKASPGEGLLANVMAQLDNAPTTRIIRFPVKQWAAAAILLLALNVGSVIYFTNRSSNQEKTNTGNPLAAEMQLNATYNY